jgi:hypothetical protein
MTCTRTVKTTRKRPPPPQKKKKRPSILVDIIQPKSLLAYKAQNHVVLNNSWKNYKEKNPGKFHGQNLYIPKVRFALMDVIP